MVNDMPDLQEQLNQILSNPEALRQVQSLGEQLGLGGNNNTSPKPKEPVHSPPQSQQQNSLQNNTMNNMMSGDMLKMFSKIAPLMSSFKNDDETTILLHSLRPFLSPERREKIDKAEKMLKVLKLLPLIRDNGLF